MDKEEIERDMASLIGQRANLLAQLQNVIGAILYLEEKLNELKKVEKKEDSEEDNED